MMRTKASSSLQKTYDECYLICSTAVYFEGQGNESEALRSWRSALDQIYYHNAYRVPANYRAKSETEKALQDSLRDMEMQCKERVDLLEALRQSRQETATETVGTPYEASHGQYSGSFVRSPRESSESDSAERGWIGHGTIPATNYPDISRPVPALPARPPIPPKNFSEQAVVGRTASSTSVATLSSLKPSNGASLAPPSRRSSRSPSPDKGRTMKTTLRSGRDEMKTTMRPSTSSRSKVDAPVPSKAATLAWNSLGRSSKDRLGRSLNADASNSTATLDESRKNSSSSVVQERPRSSHREMHYDSTTRTLMDGPKKVSTPPDYTGDRPDIYTKGARGNSYPFPPTDPGQPGAVAGSMLSPSALESLMKTESNASLPDLGQMHLSHRDAPPTSAPQRPQKLAPARYPTYVKEYPETTAKKEIAANQNLLPVRRRSPTKARTSLDETRPLRKPVANTASPRHRDRHSEHDEKRWKSRNGDKPTSNEDASTPVLDEDTTENEKPNHQLRKQVQKQNEDAILADPIAIIPDDSDKETAEKTAWEKKIAHLMKNLPKGVDEGAAKQIFNEIVVHGDEVHWSDVAGLEVAKNALKEAVVYPFLRPDLFMGLREPARGMLLFGPPGTGKTMLARAVATESRSTFFSISASSLTSKYLGESEKLVRALFVLAKALAPSIIFVDEIDSLLSSRSGSGEHEATRRIKTEFLIQWSDLQRAAAGREQTEKEKEKGDPSRVLVLAATNLPWAIDEAARRRFVRRQYIPLPEDETRALQLRTLLGHQKHALDDRDVSRLVKRTEGFSGSDITALAKDAAMGPLRSLGEALLHMSMDEIRPIQYKDFEASLINIRPSVSKQGLKEFEDWAREYGERGG